MRASTATGCPTACTTIAVALLLLHSRCVADECGSVADLQCFANLVKNISNRVLKAEGDWHFPKLGERSVDSFRTHFCQNDLPVQPFHVLCFRATLRYHRQMFVVFLKLGACFAAALCALILFSVN
jgi:hypothetical protein